MSAGLERVREKTKDKGHAVKKTSKRKPEEVPVLIIERVKT